MIKFHSPRCSSACVKDLGGWKNSHIEFWPSSNLALLLNFSNFQMSIRNKDNSPANFYCGRHNHCQLFSRETEEHRPFQGQTVSTLAEAEFKCRQAGCRTPALKCSAQCKALGECRGHCVLEGHFATVTIPSWQLILTP